MKLTVTYDVYTEDYLLQMISYSLFVDVGGLFCRLVTNVLSPEESDTWY